MYTVCLDSVHFLPFKWTGLKTRGVSLQLAKAGNTDCSEITEQKPTNQIAYSSHGTDVTWKTDVWYWRTLGNLRLTSHEQETSDNFLKKNLSNIVVCIKNWSDLYDIIHQERFLSHCSRKRPSICSHRDLFIKKMYSRITVLILTSHLQQIMICNTLNNMVVLLSENLPESFVLWTLGIVLCYNKPNN